MRGSGLWSRSREGADGVVHVCYDQTRASGDRNGHAHPSLSPPLILLLSAPPRFSAAPHSLTFPLFAFAYLSRQPGTVLSIPLRRNRKTAMFSYLWGFALLSLAFPSATLASSHHGVPHRRHEAIAHSVSNATETVEREVAALQRRGTTYTNARLTYYDVGLCVTLPLLESHGSWCISVAHVARPTSRVTL